MSGHYILNGFSLHSNYIQKHKNKDYSWEYKHYMFKTNIQNSGLYVIAIQITI